MAFTVSLHTYKDADLIAAVEEGKRLGVSHNKATKAIMRIGLEQWQKLDEEQKKSELNK